MGGCPRLGFVLEIYKKSDQKDIANFRLISLLNIDYKFHAKLFKTNMEKKPWDTIIGKKPINCCRKQINITLKWSIVWDVTDVSKKLSSNRDVISLDCSKLSTDSVVETNLFSWLKLRTPISNVKLK